MVMTKKYMLDTINSRRNDLIEISGFIRKMLSIMDKSIKNRDEFPVERLREISSRVKNMRAVLDEEDIDLVTKNDIEEEDLRLIVGSMRLVSNLDKIARNIVQITGICNSMVLRNEYDSLTKMVNIIFTMFDGAFVGFIYREMENCNEVIKEDLVLDEMKSSLTKKIYDMMSSNGELIVYGMKMTEIISSLERIGDYLVNIAEDIVFIFSGEDIRYR